MLSRPGTRIRETPHTVGTPDAESVLQPQQETACRILGLWLWPKWQCRPVGGSTGESQTAQNAVES